MSLYLSTLKLSWKITFKKKHFRPHTYTSQTTCYMAGHSGKKIAQKLRNSCTLNSRSCGCIGAVDSEPKCSHSWNHIQFSNNIFNCHIFHVYLCPRVQAIVTVSCAVSNRETRYTRYMVIRWWTLILTYLFEIEIICQLLVNKWFMNTMMSRS